MTTPDSRPRLVQTVLDAEDIRALAEFYRELLGWEYRPGDEPGEGPEDPDWLVLIDPELPAGPGLAFQQVERLERSTWPDDAVPQQLHLDCVVDDLESLWQHAVRVEERGAVRLFDRTDDPEEPLLVYADPAGHPFCLFVG